jgi:hypothetical protein
MADKNSLLQFVAQQINPQELQGLVEQTVMELSQDPDVMDDGIEGIQELIDQLSYVAENPESYKDVLMSAIQAGIIDPADAPTEFDPVFVAVMILALEEIKARFSSQQFARGGLASAAKHLASRGRGGDTMLAHINPREAEVLRRMGGTGTINPMTGLPEFKGKAFKSIGKVFKSVAKAVIPVAATAFFGPVGGAIAGAATGAMGGGGLKGALLGGVTSSLIPGGFLGDTAKAVGSGLTSVLPSSIGNVVTKYISPATLGAGVLGGLGSSVAGQGFIPGALTAGGMAAMTPTVQGYADTLRAPGNLLSSQAAGTGIKAGATIPTTGGPGIQLSQFNPGAAIKDTSGSLLSNIGDAASANAGNIAGAATLAGAKESGLFGTGITGGQLLTGVTALQALGGMTVPQAQMAIDSVPDLSPEQKEALNRELVNYSAQWNMSTLPQAGTPEYSEMMNKIQQGIGINFMNPTITAPEQPAMARGGALSKVAMLARGTGHGRSDTINARLSDGEYVIDAETVALLGNGSTKAGASALDQMREQLRKQKGKVLAKGKFSPDAKSPLAYMKGGAR